MATTETVGSSVEQIPYVALEELGKIFFEGQNKYGVGNWKDNPSPSYRLERLRHAIRHLFLFAENDETEKHLAKVLWFCVTELYCESKYGPLRSFSSRELYPDAKHKTTITPVSEFTKPIDDLQKPINTSQPNFHTFFPVPKQYEFTDENLKNSKPSVSFETYQLLQTEFEAYKLSTQKEYNILCETIQKITSQQLESYKSNPYTTEIPPPYC
jgi:hypothetical protein